MTRLPLIALGALAMAPAALHAQTAAPTTPAASAAAPAVGTAITDSAGVRIGTVDSVTAQTIVINTGTTKVAVPPASIGKTATGFALSITKAQLDAAQAQQQAQSAATVRSQLVAGSQVKGTGGAVLGTIKAADAQTVTLTTANGVDVKLPINGFGARADGGVVLGMTAAQLAAATAGATAAPAAGTASRSATTGTPPTSEGATTGSAAAATPDGTTPDAGVSATASPAAAAPPARTIAKTTRRTRR